MRQIIRWTVPALMLVFLGPLACRDSSTHQMIQPAHVEHIEGTELSRVTLTARAAERLDIQTDQVREMEVTRSGETAKRTVVPYASVLYDPQGETWVYTSPEHLVFVRQHVDIDYIEGDTAILSDGPPLGTTVVTVGVAELYGTEFEMGH